GRELCDQEAAHALLEARLATRLRGNPERLKDPRERRKILAYLVRQGFSASAASAAIRNKSKRVCLSESAFFSTQRRRQAIAFAHLRDAAHEVDALPRRGL